MFVREAWGEPASRQACFWVWGLGGHGDAVTDGIMSTNQGILTNFTQGRSVTVWASVSERLIRKARTCFGSSPSFWCENMALPMVNSGPTMLTSCFAMPACATARVVGERAATLLPARWIGMPRCNSARTIAGKTPQGTGSVFARFFPGSVGSAGLSTTPL